MKKFEYKVDSTHDNALEGVLRTYGHDGWELKHIERNPVDRQWMCVFMREVE